MFEAHRKVALDLKDVRVIQVENDTLASVSSGCRTIVINDDGEVTIDEVMGEKVATPSTEVIEGAVEGREVIGADYHGTG